MNLLGADFWQALMAPGTTAGHISYALLVLSMMMRTLLWLRIIAIGAGTASFVYGFFWLGDPVTVIWETLFVLTNLIQLGIMAYEDRHRALDEDEKVLVDAVIPDASMAQIRRFLTLGTRHTAPPDTVLFRQNEKPDHLIVLTRGTVQIERNGRVIGACGEGDFLGEISFQTGGAATADVVVTNAVHYTAYDAEELRAFVRRHTETGAAIQASLSRNVAAKLDRASHAASSSSAA